MAVNYGGGLAGASGGALSGAGLGATLGSAFPVVGTGIGAGLGALGGGILGGLGGLFGGGNEGGVQQAQKFNPQQLSVLQLLLGQGANQLQNPYAGFAPIQQAATRNFFEQIVPGLQHQFAGSGSNALSSGALQTNLSSAGAGLAERLAAMQAEFGQRNQQNALNTLALGMSPIFENFYKQSQPGFGENLLSSSFQNAPQFYQAYQMQNLLNALKQQTATA